MGDGDSFVDFSGQVLKPPANKAVDTLPLSLGGSGDRAFWYLGFFLFFEQLFWEAKWEKSAVLAQAAWWPLLCPLHQFGQLEAGLDQPTPKFPVLDTAQRQQQQLAQDFWRDDRAG